MKLAIFTLILLSGCLFGFAAPGLEPDPENVPNLQEPRYMILTAGQPTEVGFREIASLGVRTVINVLPDEECWPDEPAVVNGQTMQYIQLPFETTGFKMETIRRFAALLQSEEKPILVHCSTGNHAGGLWFAYRVLMEKAPVGTALKEARKIGLKQELEDALIDWVMEERDR